MKISNINSFNTNFNNQNKIHTQPSFGMAFSAKADEFVRKNIKTILGSEELQNIFQYINKHSVLFELKRDYNNIIPTLSATKNIMAGTAYQNGPTITEYIKDMPIDTHSINTILKEIQKRLLKYDKCKTELSKISQDLSEQSEKIDELYKLKQENILKTMKNHELSKNEVTKFHNEISDIEKQKKAIQSKIDEKRQSEHNLYISLQKSTN